MAAGVQVYYGTDMNLLPDPAPHVDQHEYVLEDTVKVPADLPAGESPRGGNTTQPNHYRLCLRQWRVAAPTFIA